MSRPVDLPDWIAANLELAPEVFVSFTRHSPGLYPNAPTPSGGLLTHRAASGDWCTASFAWWRPEAEVRQGRPVWHLESLVPLTLTPSFRCACGFHGHIARGQWVSA